LGHTAVPRLCINSTVREVHRVVQRLVDPSPLFRRQVHISDSVVVEEQLQHLMTDCRNAYYDWEIVLVHSVDPEQSLLVFPS
jgi:hypothetical protein